MNRIKEVFGKDKVLLPVVHVGTGSDACTSIEIAELFGADGVFLINHGISPEGLMDVVQSARDAFPGLWIGINRLGVRDRSIFEGIAGIQGVWTDNACIMEYGAYEIQPEAELIDADRQLVTWQGLYFGGVAFKYQRGVKKLEKAASIAVDYMDVVTTSGTGTGVAADVEKVKRMKSAMGDSSLALASGVTPENVEGYLPYVDAFLVATGISKDFWTFDPKRVRQLVEKVHEPREL